MEFTSQICTTREQSERLLALGLKTVTADCVVSSIGSKDRLIHTEEPIYVTESLNSKKIPNYPAWSLHRLIEMLPDSLFDWYGLDFSKRGIFYADFRNGSYSVFEAFAKSDKTLYDNIIDCIEWLIKEGHFNKEYLEE